ncbi:g-type lectin s-receptor-like serine/threonine-protein kinase [Quercus suber]|uniref:G-type lectin s-receptor-like serine/threonine-protein kinase n=1 Tax=Quercus suber TaxID=58331 RepID=A0AAW0M987_QUESU
MASRARNLFLVFSCLLPLLGPSYSKLADKLVHGKELKDGDELVSANENFIIRFFKLAGIAYLGIWYNRNNEKPVWDANRSTPIADKCSVLTIDDDGNLRISYIGYQSKILCSVLGESNTSAILVDVGNFVLYEGNSEGSVKRDLRPNTTDTHVPGRSWPTTPKGNRDVHDLGSFILNNRNQLVILWRGNIHCSTGPWFNGRSNSSSYGLSNQNYFNFGFISNENKTYFSDNNCSWVDFGYAFDTRASTGEIWRRDTSSRSNRLDGLRELCVPESKGKSTC